MFFNSNRNSKSRAKPHKKYLIRGKEGTFTARYGVKIPCKWANLNFYVIAPKTEYSERNIYVELVKKQENYKESKFDWMAAEITRNPHFYRVDPSEDLIEILFSRSTPIEQEFNIAYEWITEVNNIGSKFLKFSEDNEDGYNAPRSSLFRAFFCDDVSYLNQYLNQIKKWSEVNKKFDSQLYLNNLNTFIKYWDYEIEFFDFIWNVEIDNTISNKFFDLMVPFLCKIDGSERILDNIDQKILFNYTEAVPYLKKKKITHLKLTYLERDEFPKALFDLDLEELEIDNGDIRNIPDDIQKLKSLKKLKLKRLKIKEISPSIGKLENLEYLYIYLCPLQSIPKEIQYCKSLKEITLVNNNFSSFPEIICAIDKLEHLSFSNQQKLQKINFYCIGRMKNLKKLILSKNKLNAIPNSFSKLKQLSFLDLNRNDLKEIPNTILEMSNLQTLKIENNHIKSLPKDIGKLSHLEILHLAYNEISQIPEEISNLSCLRALSVEYNNLKKLPSSLRKIKTLIAIDICYNNIIGFPKELKEMKGLRNIYLNGYGLKSVPKELLDFPNLTMFSVDPLIVREDDPVLITLLSRGIQKID